MTGLHQAPKEVSPQSPSFEIKPPRLPKKIWMLAECFIPNAIGFWIDSSLGFWLSVCCLILDWISDDREQQRHTRETRTIRPKGALFILWAIALSLALFTGCTFPARKTATLETTELVNRKG